jgi:hypothetical protein
MLGAAGHLAAWKVLVDSPMPHTAPLPEPWAQRLDSFQRLLLLRALRQDKLLPAVTNYVADTMGRWVSGLAGLQAGVYMLCWPWLCSVAAHVFANQAKKQRRTHDLAHVWLCV